MYNLTTTTFKITPVMSPEKLRFANLRESPQSPDILLDCARKCHGRSDRPPTDGQSHVAAKERRKLCVTQKLFKDRKNANMCFHFSRITREKTEVMRKLILSLHNFKV